jgi:beta-galactosidase
VARIKFVTDRILVDGRPGLLFGGEYQYFRMRRDLWEPMIEAVKEAGINTISIYIPWVWHEVQEGEFDFDGRTQPERDLRGFLYLCRRHGLSLITKPGPYIYAEYQGFGIPLWLRDHYPDTKMVLPARPDYPEIALRHPKFLALTRTWFGALAPLLKPLVQSGEVVALQLDNETGMPQYGAGPYLSDHNPETIRQLRDWLGRKYESIADLNASWGTAFPTFDAIRPPEKPVARTQLLDLAKFVEDYLVDYLAQLKTIWQELGVDTHFYLNDIWMPAWPNHWSKKNHVAPVGFDMYPKFIRVKTTLDQPFTISYVPKVFDAMRLGGPLMGPEVGGGWLDDRVKVSEIATLQKMLASYLRGSQANVLYPVHDGTDPDSLRYKFAAAFDHEGKKTGRMEVISAIGRFVGDWGALLANSQAVESPVAVLHNHDSTRDVLEFAIDPTRTARETLDLAIDRSVTLAAGSSGVFGALCEAGYDPDVLELRRVALSDLARHAVSFFSCTGSASAEVREKLIAYVEGGGHLVVLGAPFEDPENRLFPGTVKRTWRPQALAVVAGAFLDLASFNLSEARRIAHPLVRFTVEKLQPVMGLIKYGTRAGVWLNDPVSGQKVWGARFVTYCQVPEGGREILDFMGQSIGYTAPVGAGTISFIGTLLGPHLDSPGYYLDAPERGKSVSEFLARLAASRGVTAQVPGAEGIEVVLRKVPDGMIVALINRRGERHIDLDIPGLADPHVLARQFSYRGSRAEWMGRLAGILAAEDVMITHLSRSLSP